MVKPKLTEGEIQTLLSKYVREKNMEAVSAIKMVKTRISMEKGRLKNVKELAEDEILRIVRKELKEIQETIDSLRKAGMEHRIQEEERKAEVLEELLPAALSEGEVQKIIDEAVRDLGKEDFGKIMKAVTGKVAGRADGKLVSSLVRKAISG